MQKIQRRIKIRLFFVQLISILPLLLFIFYLLDLWYDTGRSMALKANITQVKLVAMFIDNSLTGGLRIGNNLAHDILLQQALAKDKEVSRGIIKNIITDAPEIASIGVFNRQGELVVNTLDLTSEQEKATITDREYYQEVLKTKKKVISSPLLGRYSGKQIIVMSIPIIKNDEVVNLINVSYKLDYLKNQIEKIIPASNHQNIIVLDKNKQIIFLSNQTILAESNRSILADASFIKETQAGKTVVIENQPIPLLNNKRVIGAGVPITDFGWVVLSVEPIENVFAPFFKVQSVVWLIIFVALVFSISVISYFLRKVKIVY